MNSNNFESTLSDFARPPDNLTPLYALPVINAGTSNTQALTSYLGMLAMRHRLSIKTLMKFIREYCEVQDINCPTINYVTTCRLDAGGKYAERLMDVLQVLTGVSVFGCSWLKFQRTFAGNFQSIVRATRQWCDQCYSESREKYTFAYEPLLWSYPGATVCPTHKMRYEDSCAKCGQLQPVMGGQLNHWYCNYCRSELVQHTSRSSRRVDTRSMAWNMWLHRELGLLVSGLWDPGFIPKHANFRLFVSLLAKDDVHGCRGLSKRTGIGENTLSQWTRRGPPAFKYFIWFCAALGVSPRTVLTAPIDAMNEIGEWPAPIEPEPRQKRLNVTRNDWPEIRRKMHCMIATETPIPGADEVCRMLGVSPSTLRYREPALLRRLLVKRNQNKTRARIIATRNLMVLGSRIFKEMREEHRHLTRITFESELIGRSGCGYRAARIVYSRRYRGR